MRISDWSSDVCSSDLEIVDQHVVLLLETRVRDAGHDGELLVRVGQLLEEAGEILEAGDAVVLAAQDDGRHGDLLRVDQRQPGAHVDVGAVDRKSTRLNSSHY